MDLVKIGKYIAGKRKAQGMTQRQLLGISINEFLAGEDIVREDIAQKSEENIIGLATDSKQKQKHLKYIIGILLTVTLIVIVWIGGIIVRKNMPQNFIGPIDKNSIEMKTAETLSGVDGAFIYQYTATDDFKELLIHILEYHNGKLVDKQTLGSGYTGMESPHNGTIVIVPQFNDFSVKLIIADEGAKLGTELPILEDVPEREYYMRTATEIQEDTDITYDEE